MVLKLKTSLKKKEKIDKNKSVAESTEEILESHEIEVDGETIIIEKAKGLDGKACWKGYKLAGTKKKGGKTVTIASRQDLNQKVRRFKRRMVSMQTSMQRESVVVRCVTRETRVLLLIKHLKTLQKLQKKEEVEYTTEKKLDPVGKEDKDIDNDGDHDKSDKYLLARRKKVGKIIAMSKKK